MSAPIDLTGQTFGRLKVVKFFKADVNGWLWEVRCACGETRFLSTKTLRSAHQVSCGCARREVLRARAQARRIHIEDGKRRCPGCSRDVEVEGFNKNSCTVSGLQSHCKRCVRERWLMKEYGITLVEYEAILTAQGGHCAICPATEGLDVDHCHKRKKVRGILCGPHNRALGLLQDNLRYIAKLFHYVEGANEAQKMNA
jgi:hypothetical protein